MLWFLCPSYVRTQNNLFAPENLARLSPGYAKAYDLIDVEKNCVLGGWFAFLN